MQLVVGSTILILVSTMTAWMIRSVVIMNREHKAEEEKAKQELIKKVKREKSRAKKMKKS